MGKASFCLGNNGVVKAATLQCRRSNCCNSTCNRLYASRAWTDNYITKSVDGAHHNRGMIVYFFKNGNVIQIKICAEYRDMLPRPRLVCQEPGLRPIGRSPGVPDKSSRGLGSMSRYSAQILICFIAYIFSIFNFSVGLVGNLAELPPCTVPPATVHCYQNEAAQCSSDNQISQHALLRGSRKKHSLAFMPQNWWN